MNILEMNHVSKAFGGSKALSDIHLTVEEARSTRCWARMARENLP